MHRAELSANVWKNVKKLVGQTEKNSVFPSCVTGFYTQAANKKSMSMYCKHIVTTSLNYTICLYGQLTKLSNNSYFQATTQNFNNVPIYLRKDYIKRLCGVLKNPDGSQLPVKPTEDVGSLPESFDAREQWPECPTLKEVRDQGSCGSCYVSFISNAKICKTNKQTTTRHVSKMTCAGSTVKCRSLDNHWI